MPVISLTHATLLLVLLQKVTCRSPTASWSRSEVLRDPKIYYITTELACADGYPVQEHRVVTDDGYILTVHRIPNGQRRVKVPRREYHYHRIHRKHHPDFDDCMRESSNATSGGLPVLFVHGILMASDGWLLQGPGSDLAYLMADKGYDVWLANVRGNFYSRQHTTMSASDPEFWNFSFHENAMHDIPSIIDYILKLTKRVKIGFLGYSMGTTIFFAMASLLPEYQDKILGFVGLAPVAFIKEENMSHRRRLLFNILLRILVGVSTLPEGVVPAFSLTRLLCSQEDLRNKGDVHELFPRSNLSLTIGRTYCSKGSQLQDLCYEIISLSVGYSSKLVLRSKFHLYLTHIPTGTSLKTLVHYQQSVRGNSFKQFEYGTETNVKIYGTATAPDYPLGCITTPVALHFSKDDFYYDVKDIQELVRHLPNVVEVDQLEKFNHADFFWSYKAKDSLYQKVISGFEKFQDQCDFPRGGARGRS